MPDPYSTPTGEKCGLVQPRRSLVRFQPGRACEDKMLRVFGEDVLPGNTTRGDGALITTEELDHVRRVYHATEVDISGSAVIY